jgi:hypothetical protein
MNETLFQQPGGVKMNVKAPQQRVATGLLKQYNYFSWDHHLYQFDWETNLCRSDW